LGVVLKRMVFEAARLVTGALKGTQRKNLKETAWFSLKERRNKLKLTMIYKLINNLVPLYLSELCPKYVKSRTNYDLRANDHLIVPFSRTKRFKDSFLISSINLWNNLPESVRSSPSLDCFKNNVIRYFDASTCNPLYYVSDRLPAIFHTRFRLSNSTLNYDLFFKKCVSSTSCACGYPNETTSHFFFDCNQYAAPRVKLLTSAALLLGTSWLNASRKTRLIWLLNGNISDFSIIVNKSLFTSVQRFIVESGRFACGCS
jgi:hypothetical protein